MNQRWAAPAGNQFLGTDKRSFVSDRYQTGCNVYENMVINEVFPAVKISGVAGLEKVSILIKHNQEDIEFLNILQFDCLESVKTFAGKNFQKAYIPDAARSVLLRYQETAEHYRLSEELIY